MFQNYFKVALRNILKHKFYSTLNIAGLAFGLTACFLIGLYVFDELSYDKFHDEAENVYRIKLFGKIGEQQIQTTNSCPPLAAAMVQEIPGVEQSIRIDERSNMIFKYDDKAFTEKKILCVDSNFFDFFSFRLVEGDPKTALKQPNSLVLTKAIAQKYFGTETPINKIMTVGNDTTAYKVTGIVEAAPSNSHIQFDVLVSATSDDDMISTTWLNNGLFTYFRKNRNTTIESVDAKLRDMVITHVGPEVQQYFGTGFDEFEKKGGVYGYYSYPMLDTHLYTSNLEHDMMPPSDIKYVYIVSAMGIFILLIACINFMNLSTARSASRAKEVGLRKTLGSLRSTLISQFLAESFIYTLAGTLLAIGAMYVLLPGFNTLSGKQLHFYSLRDPIIFSSLIAIFLVVSLLAGSYPAFYLTSFNPVEVLKGKVKAGMRSKGIRSSLVVIQFTISIALIICTLIVYNQLNYLQDKNLGLDKKSVLVLRNTRMLASNINAFKEELSNESGIASASYTNNTFPGVNNTTVFREAGSEQDRMMGQYFADYDHLNVLKIELAEGRFFSKDFLSDSTACVLNEAAVRELGWKDPLNEKLTSFIDDKPFDMNVVGVVKDFNFQSLKINVRPLVIRLTKESNTMLIRYEGSASEAVSKIEGLWKKRAINQPFEYTFLDENFDQLFREEQRLGKVFSVMTGIAIFVACLGLLGLASFTAEQRTKEIGIRKVLGASVSSVNTLLSKEFILLVGISFVLASGIAWYAMNTWLSTFAYRIEMGVTVFIISGVMALSIALATVSFHFVKAARSNPTEALKYE